MTALDRGYLDALGSLIFSLGPTEPAPSEWEEAEAALHTLIMCFQAAFTASPHSLSRLTMFE